MGLAQAAAGIHSATKGNGLSMMRYLLPVILFVLTGFSSNQVSEKKLYIVTGFGSQKLSISKQELTVLYRAGHVYVSVAVKEITDQLLSGKGKPIAIKDFIRIAKDKLFIIRESELTSQLRMVELDGVGFNDFGKPYPLSGAVLAQDSVTKISITGVTALTRSIGMLMNEKGYGVITQKLKSAFQASDYVHISNEVSLMDSCAFSHRGRVFCSKVEHFKALLDLKCNVVELTGNHNKDFGEQSFIKTLAWYKANGINTFGGGLNDQDANKPLVLTLKDGTRLGWIGFNELCPLNECAKPTVAGANRWNREKARLVIQQMKRDMHVDVVIASVQFGEWDFYQPQKGQRSIARDLIDFGADLVYGAHAHQIQQVEFYKSKPIFYGLGNFLFDEIQRIGVRQGMFINVFIRNGKIIQTEPVYTFMGQDRVNALADSAQAAGIKKVILVDSLLYR
jgi:poly-gamma-glutamate capsule biosynthesis protein CapA/YwtB (metallophosphatase superfamily)